MWNQFEYCVTDKGERKGRKLRSKKKVEKWSINEMTFAESNLLKVAWNI